MSARMRWLLLLALAGCPSRPPAASRPNAPSAIRARIDQGTSTWVDVTVTGPGDQARVLCERVTNSEMQLGAKLAHPCADQALPAIAHTGVELLEVDQVTSGDLALDDLMAGTSRPGVPDARARVERHMAFPDRASCERMRDRLAHDDASRREDAERVRVDDHAKRVRAANDKRDAACGQVAEGEAQCAVRKGDERTQCNSALEPKRVVCRDATRQRAELDDAPPAPNPTADRVCR